MTNRFREATGAPKDLIVLLVLFAMSALFFARVLFTSDVLVGDTLARYIPWNYYLDPESEAPVNYEFDTLLAYYPQFLFAKQALQGGELPLWNPYYLSGMPLLAAAPWLGLFYAPYALFYLTDTLKAFGYVSFLQLGMGGSFMYLFLRSIHLRWPAALVGAVSFGLGGFLLGNLTWLPRVSTAIWMPLILFSVENCIAKRQWLYALLGAVAVAMCILAGNMAAAVYVLLAACLYTAFRLIWAWKRDGPAFAVKCALVIIGAVGVGLLLSAVQLFPTIEVSAYASRIHAEYDDTIEGGRSALALATVLVPDIFGNPVDRPWGRNEFATNIPGTYGETSLYAGIVPLFLGVWAVARRRDVFAICFGLMALVSLLVFVDTPLFRMLYHFPLFRIGRPLEAKAMWACAVSVLAALGFDGLLEQPASSEGRAVPRAVLGLLCAAALAVLGAAVMGLASGNAWLGDIGSLANDWGRYNAGNLLRLGLLLGAWGLVLLIWKQGRIGSGVLLSLCLSLALADLAYFGWKLNPPREPKSLYPEMDSVRFLQADGSVHRTVRGPLSRKVFPPNSLSVYGISDVQGYSPILIDYYVEFVRLIEEDIASSRRVYSLKHPSSMDSWLLDLLNAKYIVTIADPGEEAVGLGRTSENLELVYDGEVKIYENKDVLPRAFFVTDYVLVEDETEALEMLRGGDFDPATVVLLEQEASLPDRQDGMAGEASRVEIVKYAANAVTVTAEVPVDGFIVLSDLFYDGWRVFVDGVEQQVLRADYVFRAVQVESGTHHIEFVFDPLSFRIGSGLSLVAVASVVVAAGIAVGARLRSAAHSRNTQA